jgi:hypothetical protein
MVLIFGNSRILFLGCTGRLKSNQEEYFFTKDGFGIDPFFVTIYCPYFYKQARLCVSQDCNQKTDILYGLHKTAEYYIHMKTGDLSPLLLIDAQKHQSCCLIIGSHSLPLYWLL